MSDDWEVPNVRDFKEELRCFLGLDSEIIPEIFAKGKVGPAWFSFLKFCFSFEVKVYIFSIYLSIYLFIQSVPPRGAEHTTKRGSNLSVSLQITHPAQERLATPTGI